MPLFVAQVFKTHPFQSARPISNTYIFLATDLTDAVTAEPDIVAFERPLFDSNFFFTYVRVSTLLKGDSVYATIPVNLPGTRSASGDTLPLFNTIRVDVSAGTGRPSRFHYRGLHEGEQFNNEVDSGLRSTFSSAWATFITVMSAAGHELRQGDDDTLIAASTSVKVSDRSLHRKRRKKGI